MRASKVLKHNFVDPEVGNKMSEMFRRNQADGRYGDLTSAAGLAYRLTLDRREIRSEN